MKLKFSGETDVPDEVGVKVLNEMAEDALGRPIYFGQYIHMNGWIYDLKIPINVEQINDR